MSAAALTHRFLVTTLFLKLIQGDLRGFLPVRNPPSQYAQYNSYHPDVLRYGSVLYNHNGLDHGQARQFVDNVVGTSLHVSGELPQHQVQANSDQKHPEPYANVVPKTLQDLITSDKDLNYGNPPYDRLPHRYTSQPTSLDATHTHVPDFGNPEKQISTTQSPSTEGDSEAEHIENEEERDDDSEEASTEESDVDGGRGLFESIELPTASPNKTRVPKQARVKDLDNEIDDFRPSKAGPPVYYPQPEFDLPSKPVSSPFGVSVDFAGKLSDNPLFKDEPFEDKGVFEREIIPDHILAAQDAEAHKNLIYYKPYIPNVQDIQSSTEPEYKASPIPTTETAIFDPYLDTNFAPPHTHTTPQITPYSPPPVRPIKPLRSPQLLKVPERKKPRLPPKALNRVKTSDKALLVLGPSGPSMPVFKELAKDLAFAVSDGSNPPKQFAAHPQDRLFDRVANTLDKMMGGHFGDRAFDLFDFLPLMALLIGSGILLAGLFPNGFGIVNAANGSLVINGRSERKEDNPETTETLMDKVEAGIMMISALRHEDQCAERLACRLGDLAKDSFEDQNLVLGAINLLIPRSFSNFTRSFENVVKGRDRSSCQKACYRCISL